jgi:ABC-type cobalamin/Fe3+-siderophores transport system ATPase subunit
MAIRSFAVGPLRSLVRAEAHGLGNLIVLAGPNGAGKSTLLDLLRQQRHAIAEPGTEVMFVGPPRTWRSTRLDQLSAHALSVPSFGELLKVVA